MRLSFRKKGAAEEECNEEANDKEIGCENDVEGDENGEEAKMKKELEENEKGEKRESEEKEGNDETGDKSQECQERGENNKEAVQSDQVASDSSQRDGQSDAPVALKLNEVREKSSAFEKAAVAKKEEGAAAGKKGPADGNEGRNFKIVANLSLTTSRECFCEQNLIFLSILDLTPGG